MSKIWKIVLIVSLLFNLSIVYVAYKALEYRAHINEFLDKYTYVVREFSGRNRYEQENKHINSPNQEETRVVFLGSQLTENWDLKKWFPKYDVINRGISGQRMAGFILRFVPDVIELNPKVVVIEFPSYNFRKEYSIKELQDYIESMATLAKANDIEPILTTIIPTREELDNEGYKVNDSLIKFNDWLRKYSSRNKIVMIDYYKLIADQDGLLPQDISISHIELNDKGYQIISEELNNILDSLTDSNSF